MVAPDSVRSGLVDAIQRRDRAPPRRSSGPDPDQGQLHRRRGDHRRALPRLARRRAGRAADPRHLRRPARRARPLRDHPGPLDPGPLPRAQPDHVVRERWRAGGLDRLLGPDAPQPRPPRRGAGQAALRRRGRRGHPPARPRLRPAHRRLGARLRRHLDPGRRPPTTSRCATSRRCSSPPTRRRRAPGRGRLTELLAQARDRPYRAPRPACRDVERDSPQQVANSTGPSYSADRT